MSSPHTQFTFGQRAGLLFTVEGAVLSVISVSIVLGLAIYKWLQRTVISWGRRNLRKPDASDSSLFLNLMLADLVQAIGIMPSIKWMENGIVTEGHLCTAQAALKQVGINGVAWTSLAIAIHTFSILILRWNPPKHASKAMVIGVWVLTALIVGIPAAVHRNQHYYGASGYWCWITQPFQAERIVTEYLWVWLAGIVMIALYTIMFAVMRGWLVVDNGIHWYKDYNPSDTGEEKGETEEEKEMKAIANLMLFYPMVYIICVLPNTVSRWLSFHDAASDGILNGTISLFPPYQFTFFANTIYALSGMANVILFFATRPELVVSPTFTVDAEQVPLSEHSGVDSNNLGHLPHRQSTGLSPNIVETSPQSDWTPNDLLHASPLTVQTSLPSRRSGSLTGYPPLEKVAHQRSKGSSLQEEEEDYGHLPQN